MKVLLTGASGFLGRHVRRCLARHYLEVVALGRVCPADVAADAFIDADLLATPELVDRLREQRVTHLLHLAWETEHGVFWSSPRNFEWVDASLRLVRSFAAAGGRHVVAAGSCAEYDWSHGLCREHSTPLLPASVYGVTKDATRRLLSEMCDQQQMSLAWGRLFLSHGEGEDDRRLVPSLIDALSGRRPAFAVNRHAWRDFLHASDIAEGLVTLLRYGARGDYNLSSGQPLQLAELVRRVAAKLDADPAAVLGLESPERRGEPALLVGESQRLQALGWRPRLTLDSALTETLNARLANGEANTTDPSTPMQAQGNR